MAHTPTIACDFDGCLCEHAFPECGAPMEEVVELLRLLDAEGWCIVIHSCRTNSDWVHKGATLEEALVKVDDMLHFLAVNRVPFDDVWGIDRCGSVWTYSGISGKPVADVYLDDRALHPVGALTAADLHLACSRIVSQGGDPLAFHRSLGRSAD